ncbi:MAG: DUF4907 domain-containing protein [Parabacteroides sp.]
MKSKKIIKVSAGLVLLSLLFSLVYFHGREMGSRRGQQLELQTFQLRNGWGYRILVNKKTLIYQPTIPAIYTIKAFPNEKSARKTGEIVMNRIKQNKDFSITTDDLKHSLSD